MGFPPTRQVFPPTRQVCANTVVDLLEMNNLDRAMNSNKKLIEVSEASRSISWLINQDPPGFNEALLRQTKGVVKHLLGAFLLLVFFSIFPPTQVSIG